MQQQIKLFEPSKPQRAALKIMYEDKPFVTLLKFGRQTGKAQPLDSILYTNRGPIRMGDVKIGDFVAGSNGFTEVIAIHPQGKIDTYRVSFDDGTFVDCNDEHLWEIEDHHRNIRILSTRELIDNGVSKERIVNKRTYNKFSVRTPDAINFNVDDIPDFDYYYFGLWLGDGTTIRPNEITTADEETVDYLESLSLRNNMSFTRDGYKCFLRTPSNKNPIINQYTQLGLKGFKHIPNSVLYSSIENRIKVLQGIMDTDGYISDGGYTELVTIKERLKDDYLTLARGLGLHASVKDKWITYRGKKHHSYRINIRYNGKFPLFNLKRKAEKHKEAIRASNKKFITSIEKLDYKSDMQCITVDAKDSLYVTGDGYTLTHNSYLFLMDMIVRCLNTPRLRVRYVVPAYSLATKHMMTIDALFAEHMDVKDRIFKGIKYKEQTYTFANGSVAMFLSAEAEDNLRGDTCDYMYIDEAAFIKESVYTEILLPMLTRTNGNIAMCSTPNGKNWFYDLYMKGQREENSALVRSIEATYLDLSDEEDYESILRVIESLRASMTKNAFNREVMAEFISDLSLFTGVRVAIKSDNWYEEYFKSLELYEKPKKYIGIDIGVVHDYTVLTCIDSNNVVIDIDRFNMVKEGYTSREFKDRIVAFLNKHDRELVSAYIEINNNHQLYDELLYEYKIEKLWGITTTANNKPEMVNFLIKLFDDYKISIPENLDLERELYAFTAVQNKITNKWQYKGTEGINDDMVMALVLAAYCKFEESYSGITEVYR